MAEYTDYGFSTKRYKRVCEAIFSEIRAMLVPNPETRYKPGGSTGNLALNAFQYRWEGNDGLTFHMFVDEEIAPHMVFTNEPWLAARWHGKRNPNQNWWNDACEYFMYRFAQTMGGTLRVS